MENIGMSEKERNFVTKWSKIRNKGKFRYVITRGVALGLLLFAVWLIVTIVEVNASAFQKAYYTEHTGEFIERCVLWFVCFSIQGFILAFGIWKRKEEKRNYLS